MKLAEVILRDSVRQTDRIYTYKIPAELDVREGSYVSVPFGNGNVRKKAVVTGFREAPDDPKLKSITELIDDLPVLTSEQIKLIKPISSRFNCTMGDVISLMVPSMVGRRMQTSVTMVDIIDRETVTKLLNENKLRSVHHINILEYLLEAGKTEQRKLILETGTNSSHIRALCEKGLITKEKETGGFEENPGLLDSVTDPKFSEVHELNQEQKAAVERITDFTPGSKKICLLHGITGSGKTEVYLNCAEKILKDGGAVLYMVPEISLTPQTISWIRGRLSGKVAVLHSKLTEKQKHEQWDLIRRGIVNVVVAPRSGVFAPIKDLKLIIIDEEHDASYKSSDSHPHYNTKDIANMRSKLTGAKIILGSATPSVESYYGAKEGYYELIELKERANAQAKLPKVHPVDMKEQLKMGAGEMLSIPLRNAMARAFAEGHQVVLFLNRRGYSRTLVCNDCGDVCMCKYCSVGMTLHNNRRSGERLLICHYCGRVIPASEAECLSCGGRHFSKVGFGTEQLEEMLKELFPKEKVLRMDQDTTVRAGAHQDIINAFRNKEASILVGTQMIAKGHDFANVTVVGILGADLMLNSSSYKSSERAFQLITQAAGRAGRGEDPGDVYIQSRNIEEPLFKYAASQDYKAFYEAEIMYRNKLGLPPFKAIGDMVLSTENEEETRIKAYQLADYVKKFLSVQDPKYAFEVMGPVPDVFYELRGRYRYIISVKAVSKSAVNAVFKQVMKDFDPKIYPISFDNDGMS